MTRTVNGTGHQETVNAVVRATPSGHGEEICYCAVISSCQDQQKYEKHAYSRRIEAPTRVRGKKTRRASSLRGTKNCCLHTIKRRPYGAAKLWRGGISQPPFLLTLAGRYLKLGVEWNVRGLGRLELGRAEWMLLAEGAEGAYQRRGLIKSTARRASTPTRPRRGPSATRST